MMRIYAEVPNMDLGNFDTDSSSSRKDPLGISQSLNSTIQSYAIGMDEYVWAIEVCSSHSRFNYRLVQTVFMGEVLNSLYNQLNCTEHAIGIGSGSPKVAISEG